MTKIVVLDGHTLNPGDNPWTDLESLAELTVYPRTPRGEVVARAREADIVLTNKTPLGAAEIAQLSRLRFVAVLATGYNVVDTAAARVAGIPVSNVPSYGTASVAQHVLALMLELTNHVGRHARSVASGGWGRCPDFCYWEAPLVELKGQTMGIVGFGRIGQQVAQVAHALGMRIIYSARSPKAPPFPAEAVSLSRLFADADVVSLHCNQTTENLKFVNAALLQTMKRSAIFINTARGTLVDEGALAAALRDGRLSAAALDVLSTEPPTADNPLIGLPNCLVTPHVAWSSTAARRRLMQVTAANVRAFLRGAPQNVVNP